MGPIRTLGKKGNISLEDKNNRGNGGGYTAVIYLSKGSKIHLTP